MTTIRVEPGENLQRTIDAAPSGSTIRLAAGEWREKLMIRTPEITIIGEGQGKSRIVFDDYARKPHPDGREYNTFRTYTVAVTADGVTMKELSIVNDSGHPEVKGQEVALTVYGDRFHMEKCELVSTQDTLFAGPLPPDLCERYVTLLPSELRDPRPLRQTYRDCVIVGTVDFIFGCADALFEDCEIRSGFDVRDIGYCAAPAHPLDRTEGFVFRNCRFTREEGVSDASIYLARPWRDYGISRFENCQYDAHIRPEGFDKWNDTDRDRTARFFETPAVEGRVPWINRDR